MAKKAAATRKARGIKSGFAKLSTSQRSSNARKAAATRKARGVKTGFARATAAQRSSMAHKAAATRKAKGEKPFANMTAEQKHERALKAAATRAKTHPPHSINSHNRLHKRKRSHYDRHPTAHKLNPLKIRKKRPVRAVHVRRRSHYDKAKRMII